MEWLIDRVYPDADTQRQERYGFDVYSVFGTVATCQSSDCRLRDIHRLFIRRSIFPWLDGAGPEAPCDGDFSAFCK